MVSCLVASSPLKTQQQQRYTITIFSTTYESNTINFNTAPFISPSEAAVLWIQGREERIRWQRQFSTQESPFLSPSEVVVVAIVVIFLYYYYYKSEIVAIFAQKFCMKYCDHHHAPFSLLLLLLDRHQLLREIVLV